MPLLKTFLDSIVGISPKLSVRALPPASFNKVVAMIMPSESERTRSLTGRKIRHLCIMGYHTMGQPNIPCPSRDLFELLHVFPNLKEDKYKNFYELLSHVVCKKSLYRENQVPDATGQTIRTGLLIPGPTDKGGDNQWFYVDGFYDDSKGNVNYVLLPACDGYNQPLIKLYRSTSTNRNAENALDSVMADLNPKGPGSMSPELSLPYEREHFFERTIPIWMGYLVFARTAAMRLQQGNEPQAEAERVGHLKRAVEAFKRYSEKLPREGSEEDVAAITALYENKRFDDLERGLVAIGHKYREDPRYKKPQDMAFVGHSLGATLAQQGVYYFSTFYERMPLPHHQFICYSSDGPAVTNDQDLEFMRFGRSNRELFKTLGVKWRIYQQFESGDFVPQSGGSHLGTTGYDEYGDRDWLREIAGVFSPLDGAKALSIITPPTHGRRIGTANCKTDYTYTRITPKELGEYDHSSFLSKKMRAIWKYRLFNSPRLTEKIRRVTGSILQGIGVLRYLDNAGGNGVGQRDGNGVLAVRYIPTLPALSPVLA